MRKPRKFWKPLAPLLVRSFGYDREYERETVEAIRRGGTLRTEYGDLQIAEIGKRK